MTKLKQRVWWTTIESLGFTLLGIVSGLLGLNMLKYRLLINIKRSREEINDAWEKVGITSHKTKTKKQFKGFTCQDSQCIVKSGGSA